MRDWQESVKQWALWMTPTLFPPTLPSATSSCWRLSSTPHNLSGELSIQQQAAELSRVLDETAASYEELQETHQATIDELNALKRWIYGRRRERLLEGEGQGHLFELNPPSAQPFRQTQLGSRPNNQSLPTVAGVAENSTSTSCRTIGTSTT